MKLCLKIEKYPATGEETDFAILKVSSNVKWLQSNNFNYHYHIFKLVCDLFPDALLFVDFMWCTVFHVGGGVHVHTEADAVSLFEFCLLLNL